MKQLHLICNAHIDPVWLWDTEEGISAALSTFRQAAAFCEEWDGFVFNHNEALLYEWIEELEPDLFERIKRLVKAGKWHIMGGWYLQPDCNIPSGESIIRQMAYGRTYFKEKFGVEPKTAINFDPFGHSRGLVQLLAKAGYTSYLFCRPGQGDCALLADHFLWKGFDGSVVAAKREGSYGTQMGKAGQKVEEWLASHGNDTAASIYEKTDAGCILWGVGNHGGGPSTKDLHDLSALSLTAKEKGWQMIHSTPEAYFAEWEKKPGLFVFENELNHWAVGCYTSQIRIKQKHRELEQTLLETEKMAVQLLARQDDAQVVLTSAQRGRMKADLEEAWKALLFCEFHDVLPGSAIRKVEEEGLRKLDYGLNLTLRWKRILFFLMLSDEKKAEEGEYPIFVYNPHPFEVEKDIVCEFQLADQNWSEKLAVPQIYQEGKLLDSQLEKESCNLNLDWRKKLVFHAKLKPTSMNRFFVNIHMMEKQEKENREIKDNFVFENEHLHVEIDKKTGLPSCWKVDGNEMIKSGAFRLVVMKSDCDPWGMNRHSYREEIGSFALLDEEQGSDYSGTLNDRHAAKGKIIPSVRVIESGAVRTIVEAVFGFERSRACLRYLFSKQENAVGLEIQVDWAQKGCMLKLEIPTMVGEHAQYLTETMYGVQQEPGDGEEKVFQRWCAAADDKMALTVINSGNSGVDFKDGMIRISMLHSAVYSAHPIGDRPLLVQDRMLEYMDQGERSFSFRIEAGQKASRLRQIAQDADEFWQPPMAVQAFPGKITQENHSSFQNSFLTLDNSEVELAAMIETAPDEYLIRLFESTGNEQNACLCLPKAGLKKMLVMKPFEIKTFRYQKEKNTLEECGIFG